MVYVHFFIFLVWNKYKETLGVSSSWSFCDVYGFDPDLLAFIPRPVAALILLFPITPVYEEFRKAEDLSVTANPVSGKAWFTKQTVRDNYVLYKG